MEANFAFLHFIRQIVFRQESEEKDIWQNEKSLSEIKSMNLTLVWQEQF